MPHVALFGRGVLRRRRLQRSDDPSGFGGPHVAPARGARHAAEESFVQPRIRELTIGAAGVEPAIGRPERCGPLARVRVNAVQARAVDGDRRFETTRRARAMQLQRPLGFAWYHDRGAHLCVGHGRERRVACHDLEHDGITGL